MTLHFVRDWVEPLNERLAEVGLIQVPAENFEGLQGAAWSSSYAQLFLLPIENAPAGGWSDLLDIIDREVIRQLRKAEQSGGVVDAHVCLVFGGELQREKILASLDLQAASRRLSRKYIIDHSEGIEGVLKRLTILGPGEISASRPKLNELNVRNHALLTSLSENPAKELARQFLAGSGLDL